MNDGERITGSLSLGEMAKAHVNARTIIRIGMPESEHTANPRYGEGYKAFVLSAGTSTALRSSVVLPNHGSCAVTATFMPEAGKSYEPHIEIKNGYGHTCLKEILPDGSLKDVALNACGQRPWTRSSCPLERFRGHHHLKPFCRG